MGAENTIDALHAGTQTWSLCWQAAAGRDFQAHQALAWRIRERLIGSHRAPRRQLLYFVILPAEIHAISNCDESEPVAGIARSFSHVVSRWVREMQLVRGPVFAGPCHAEPVESIQALRREVLMLAWRPVALGLCATAIHYPHSALRIALGLKTSGGFDSGPLRACFGDSIAQARSALRGLIANRPTAEDWRVWELTRGLALPAAQAGFEHARVALRSVDVATATLIAAGGSYDVEGALRLLEIWVGTKLHPAGGIDLHRGSGTMAARGRALVACLAVTHRLCAAAAVARYFGRAKATLCEQMAACRRRPVDRAMLGTPMKRILEEAAMLRAGAGF